MVLEVKIAVPENVYLKDPQQSKLGLQLIQEGIELIEEIGYEAFTFKKLATKINSTEASVYRYFENKQQFLQFLFSWYWGWMNYKIHMETASMSSANEKLKRSIKLLTQSNDVVDNITTPHEAKLKSIINQEGIKAVLNKNVDQVNQAGAFENYKQLVEKMTCWILEINPTFAYPQMLLTTIIEGAHLQHFFATHLPRLTNQSSENNAVESFYIQLICSQISTNNG